ncbi:transcriptional regulator [Lentzea sp. NBRC 105346]|uniref:helix-turn-helix domain-containing protein n=1 Tax=Lentzea sp. NBRC 105346 TaxID=3032205 RepID=UPI0024A55ED5|nr:helix-turn-helix transcriptional regulator [Lentzea sp. NBRC 105346]GLZ34100.1 transcriptional regulator [Lentzea sp. NBRC 105346]
MAAKQADTGSEIGRRLRQIRHARRKSLAVVAGLAGISPSYLSRLESGERALDRRSLIVALAAALEVAPSEITGTALAFPGELDEDRSLNAVRLALLAASMNEPRGEVAPVDVLHTRVAALMNAQRECRYADVGSELPGLIRDLHSTLDSGRDVERVRSLLALLHVQGTMAWLMDIGASMDLGWQAATLAQHAAEAVDDPVTHAVSAFGTAFGLLGAGAFDMASNVLTRPGVGTNNPAARSARGMLTLTSSLVAAASGDRAGQVAALEEAENLAATVHDDGDPLWFGFNPANVGVWRMSVALEAGDHADAARIADSVNPDDLPSPTRKAAYYRDFGRALARLPRRQDNAVLMLRRAERISPARIHRHPFMRSVIAELLVKSRRGAIGRELRGMAYRAGLPV